MRTAEYHPFKSPSARDKYLKAYDDTEKFWPVPSESKMVNTSYGRTLVRISGPEGAPPLVLLHGMGCSSLMWLPQIKELSKDYRAFAIDDIYDYGRSIYTKAVNGPDDYVSWLNELFDRLELENINLIGMSYGGWQASQYAIRLSKRLNTIVLIAPAATILPGSFPMRAGFAIPALRTFLTLVMPEHFFEIQMRWLVKDYLKKDRKAAESFVHCYSLASKCFAPKPTPGPTVLRDSELSSIRTPALFIVGENERIYPAKKALRRLNSIAPQIETALIPDAGHDLLWAQAEMVNMKILKFLQSKG